MITDQLSPKLARQINELIDARLKHSRHEDDDHLEAGLKPQKVEGSETSGLVLTTVAAQAYPSWSVSGKSLDYQEITTGTGTGSLASGAYSAAIVSPMTVVSDGVTPILLTCGANAAPNISAGTAGLWNWALFDGTTAGTILLVTQACSATTVVSVPLPFAQRRVVLSAGSHTINMYAQNSTAGDSTLNIPAAASYPVWMRAAYDV